MNRKQRRAGAKPTTQKSNNSTLTSADDIPMSLPDKSPIASNHKVKTLYEIASEHQAQLAGHGQPFSKSSNDDVHKRGGGGGGGSSGSKVVMLSPDGRIVDADGGGGGGGVEGDGEEAEEEMMHPIFDTLFLALPMSALHFTLSVLTVHQYAQELRFKPIILDTLFIAFPTLTLVIHLLHGHLLPLHLPLQRSSSSQKVRKAVAVAQQVLFLIAANVAGCYLIHVTNDKGYYAVMKKAPSIGTVWVWSVLELGLTGALLGVAGPALFAWWNGYGVF